MPIFVTGKQGRPPAPKPGLVRMPEVKGTEKRASPQLDFQNRPGGFRGTKTLQVMATIKCNNSDRKAVSFFLNGGINILVMAMQDGEYWFSIGHGYKNKKTAKRAAVKEFAKHGYTFDAKEMENLVIE